jgi:hypothetical protein
MPVVTPGAVGLGPGEADHQQHQTQHQPIGERSVTHVSGPRAMNYEFLILLQPHSRSILCASTCGSTDA